MLDPRLIDSMDFATMQKILTGKSSVEEELANLGGPPEPKEEDVEEPDDPNDMSIPIDPKTLLR